MIQQYRLQEDIEALRKISDPCQGGVTRMGFTPSYRSGVEYVKRRMQEIGLDTYEDEVGNLYGVLPGEDPQAPSIISGSHLDTVKNAGAFDGIAGVVCALEVARVLKENHIRLKHTYEVLAFIEEEGTSFGQVLLGSRYITGDLTDRDKDRFTDSDLQSLRQVLTDYMANIDTCPPKRDPEDIHAFVEVHIEQGPHLQATGTEIGIVENIVAIAQLTVSITGFAGHAGTVPMNLRQDAGLAGYEFITRATHHVLRNYTGRATFTIGKLALLPNSANCIPNNCDFTIDLRSGHEATVDELIAYLDTLKMLITSEFGVSVEISIENRKKEVVMDPSIRQLIEQSCKKLNLSYRYMNSGAGHDAMVMAAICKTGMIFIPCDKGITHHPLEKAEWRDMVKGSALLLETILQLDQQ